jgi:translocation and assembly module TamA
VGLRWRSPVGPVRVDIAHGMVDPDESVRLHISIGPDL